MIDNELFQKLIAPFSAEDHKDRVLPGRSGEKWFYIPWRTIRKRLLEVCPEWQIAWSDPFYLNDPSQKNYCVVRCTITINGVAREGLGNSEIEQISSKGNDMSRGTPIERAKADAFKEAAEAFGIAAYLHDQEYVVKYLQSQRDGRGIKRYHDNQEIQAGARGRKILG